MKTLAILLALLLSFATIGSTANENEYKRPLDLPSGGNGEDEEDEEDEPETILFYGGAYEGDAFVWCLDKSCSMESEGKLDTLKAEVAAAVNSLSSRSEIGFVSFSSNIIVWRTIPMKSNPSNKLAAIAWIQSLVAAGGTIIGPPGIESLRIINLSNKRHKIMIVLSDGVPADVTSAIANITLANYKDIPINTILIGDTIGAAFMQELAALNDGTFRMLP